MVAECSSALTGVGPSMASGSQVSSGNCALLPMTPPKMSRAETVSRTGESRCRGLRAVQVEDIQVAEVKEHHEQAKEEGDVPQAGHDEGLLAGLAGAELLVPEPDQKIRGEPDQLPEDVKLDHGGRNGHGEHGPGEKGLKSVISGEAGVAGHVAERVHLHQTADRRHDGEHQQAQGVQEKAERNADHRPISANGP